jgi:hypothetical protein
MTFDDYRHFYADEIRIALLDLKSGARPAKPLHLLLQRRSPKAGLNCSRQPRPCRSIN